MLSTAQKSIEPNVVWKPIPNSSQEIALDTRCHITLFTGSRGPGKTDTQLMRFRRRVGIGYGEFWRGIIFDREYKHLDDLVAKSKRWFNKFNDGAMFKESNSAYKWVWPTGEELLFRVIKKKEDYDNYHGQEYPFIGWNELTKYPNSELFELMMSCNRSSFLPEKDAPFDAKGQRTQMAPIPLEVFATTNSSGPGHNWVKAEFIDPAPYGTVVRKSFTVFNPQTQREEEIVRTQVTIFGSYKENIYLDPLYVAGLNKITDENLRKSWLEGDWDVVSGGAFDDVWNKNVHVIPRCKIPSTYYLDRTFDWGSTHPFSVGWWAESNGEEMELPYCRHCKRMWNAHGWAFDHKFEPAKFAPAAGSLIRIAEWYGTEKIGKNKGLKLSAKKIAEGIRDREIEMMQQGWLPYQPWSGPADNQIRDVREDDVETIEKKMKDVGISWQESDKSPGSRRNGFEIFRGMLENATNKEGPGIYFMDNCRAAISTIPVLPRDEDKQDDVDTDAEDHVWDDTRYRVLKGKNRLATKIKVSFAK